MAIDAFQPLNTKVQMQGCLLFKRGKYREACIEITGTSLIYHTSNSVYSNR